MKIFSRKIVIDSLTTDLIMGLLSFNWIKINLFYPFFNLKKYYQMINKNNIYITYIHEIKKFPSAKFFTLA